MSWDRWRRRSPFSRIFEEMEEMMRELDEIFSKSFEEFEKEFPRGLIREKRLRDGSTVREFGPIIYGYSIKIGPDGKPEIREFGNIRPRGKPEIIELTETREPLVDVYEENDHVKVIAEVPGVEKENIDLNATEDMLVISVKAPQRKYYKEVELPAKVDPNSAKASYRNGVLEITLLKKEKKKGEEGVKIKVE